MVDIVRALCLVLCGRECPYRYYSVVSYLSSLLAPLYNTVSQTLESRAAGCLPTYKYEMTLLS